jgi:antitoxin MazE
MLIHFARWGNSLAVRIPAGLAKELGATDGLAADVTVSDGRLILTPARHRKVYRLEDLVAGITPANLHPETCTGAAIGAEVIDE